MDLLAAFKIFFQFDAIDVLKLRGLRINLLDCFSFCFNHWLLQASIFCGLPVLETCGGFARLHSLLHAPGFFGCGQSSSPNHTQQHVVKRNRPRANSRLSVFGQSRSLVTLKHWKAFEFKSFLFYGYVMLSGCLSHYISHFPCLSLAIRALVEESSDVKKRVAAGKLPLSAAILQNNTARVQRCLICMTFYT